MNLTITIKGNAWSITHNESPLASGVSGSLDVLGDVCAVCRALLPGYGVPLAPHASSHKAKGSGEGARVLRWVGDRLKCEGSADYAAIRMEGGWDVHRPYDDGGHEIATGLATRREVVAAVRSSGLWEGWEIEALVSEGSAPAGVLRWRDGQLNDVLECGGVIAARFWHKDKVWGAFSPNGTAVNTGEGGTREDAVEALRESGTWGAFEVEGETSAPVEEPEKWVMRWRDETPSKSALHATRGGVEDIAATEFLGGWTVYGPDDDFGGCATVATKVGSWSEVVRILRSSNLWGAFEVAE